MDIVCNSEQRQDERWTRLKNSVVEKSLLFATGAQPILSPNGGSQQWLLDLRRVMLTPDLIALVAELFWERMENLYPFQLAGMETAAVPLITAIQLTALRHGKPVNGIIVRKERKTSGLGRLIEGDFDDTPVIVVDDIVNSAQSLEKVRAIFVDLGVSITGIFAVVDFHSQRGLSWRQRHQIPVSALLTANDLGLQLDRTPAPAPTYTFTPLWKHGTSGADPFSVVPKSTPVSDGECIFVGADNGYLHAIRITDGITAWSFEASGSGRKGTRSTPFLHAGCIYFGAYNGAIYCLDSQTGRLLWHFTEADWIGSSPLISARNNALYIGVEYALPGRKGGILALDASTGTRLWEHPAASYIHCTPCLGADDAWLVCGDNDGYLYCLDTRTGKLIWRYQAEDAIKSAPCYDAKRNSIVAASFDGAMHIVSAATGSLEWKIKTSGILYTTALIRQDRLVFGSTDKHVYVADLNRKIVERKIALDGKILGQPCWFDQHIWIGTTGGRLYLLNDATLKLETALQLPDRIVNAILPLPAHAMLIVPTCDNRLFAYRVQKNQAASQAQAAAVMNATPSGAKEYRPESIDVSAALSEGLYYRMQDKPALNAANNFPYLPSRRLLGAAVTLLAASPRHRDLSIAQMEELLLPAIRNNQLRLFLYGVRPFGLIIWAYPAPAAAQKLLTGKERLSAEEWSGGNEAWLIDVIAPFGNGNDMVAKVRHETLANKPLIVVRRDSNGDAIIDKLPPLTMQKTN
jgi:outer membrane protein assembly factor BamB/hemolysin-activating ACP:hemolysin acyltransferase